MSARVGERSTRVEGEPQFLSQERGCIDGLATVIDRVEHLAVRGRCGIDRAETVAAVRELLHQVQAVVLHATSWSELLRLQEQFA